MCNKILTGYPLRVHVSEAFKHSAKCSSGSVLEHITRQREILTVWYFRHRHADELGIWNTLKSDIWHVKYLRGFSSRPALREGIAADKRDTQGLEYKARSEVILPSYVDAVYGMQSYANYYCIWCPRGWGWGDWKKLSTLHDCFNFWGIELLHSIRSQVLEIEMPVSTSISPKAQKPTRIGGELWCHVILIILKSLDFHLMYEGSFRILHTYLLSSTCCLYVSFICILLSWRAQEKVSSSLTNDAWTRNFHQACFSVTFQMFSEALNRGDNPSGESYFRSRRPTGAIIPCAVLPTNTRAGKPTLVNPSSAIVSCFCFSSFRYSNNHCIDAFEYSSLIRTLVT